MTATAKTILRDAGLALVAIVVTIALMTTTPPRLIEALLWFVGWAAVLSALIPTAVAAARRLARRHHRTARKDSE